MPKILCVEDDVAVLNLVAHALEFDGFEVVLAMNGEEAIEKVKADQPDLILLDLWLPKVQGFEVIQAVRADPDTRHIPVIIISAWGQKKDIERAMSDGADVFVPKPFLLEDLITHVRKYLPKESD
jgi:two-component system phosphate regulon response regulator PhoB